MNQHNQDQTNGQDLKLQRAIAHSYPQELPPAGLLQRILNRITYEETLYLLKQLKLKLWAAAGFMGMAIVGLIYSLQNSLQNDNSSFKFLSLIFTDFHVVLANWQDFSFSILENLPLTAIALILGAVLVSVLIGEYIFCRWRDIKHLRKEERQLIS